MRMTRRDHVRERQETVPHLQSFSPAVEVGGPPLRLFWNHPAARREMQEPSRSTPALQFPPLPLRSCSGCWGGAVSAAETTGLASIYREQPPRHGLRMLPRTAQSPHRPRGSLPASISTPLPLPSHQQILLQGVLAPCCPKLSPAEVRKVSPDPNRGGSELSIAPLLPAGCFGHGCCRTKLFSYARERKEHLWDQNEPFNPQKADSNICATPQGNGERG